VPQTGAVNAPPPTKICVVVPAATTSTAPAALPITNPPSASVPTPKPPLTTVKYCSLVNVFASLQYAG